MNLLRKLLRLGLVAALGGLILAAVGAVSAYYYLAPTLPSIEVLKDVQLQVPLRVYAKSGELIAEFGEMKRTPLRYEEIPDLMIKAMLAAEDDRFFEHPGVDYQGLLRAAYHLVKTGEKGQGGSTITMQVARNFFLSAEKTYLRKFSEIFLALKIEQELTKQEILELYLNKIYLGNRAYGVAAAAQIYYGKNLKDLNLAQFAMIAGLPKAPSRYNPIVNPKRAVERRDYVLRRMHELGFIDQQWLFAARNAPVTASLSVQSVDLEAPYVAEMVRAEMVGRFGESTYTAGYSVHTTVDGRMQRAAGRALRKALLDYDQRHGYRGAAGHVALTEEVGAEQWTQILAEHPETGGLVPALILAVEEQSATGYAPRYGQVTLEWAGLSWAQPYVDENQLGPPPQTAAEILQVGDIVYLQAGESGWRLAQAPQVEGALVSLRPDDGAIQALVGGFDYFQSKFNRVIQAERQPGSNFKPFVYSAALDNGFTAATVINDAPVVFEDSELESVWRPENYSGRFYGPTRLREALVNSRNLVSIRVLRSIGVGAAIRHVRRFGFDPKRLPRDLSLALGSASVTPLELARGYAVFANGGHLVDPYLIERVETVDGQTLLVADPARVCEECEEMAQEGAEPIPISLAQEGVPPSGQPTIEEASAQAAVQDIKEEEPMPRLAPRVVDAQNVYLITSMLQDVVKQGTGRRALALGRSDLAGKTGTTNEQRDAWFSGFNRDVVTTAWVGFDTPRPLGNRETGARAALPMWVDFMAEALRGAPERVMEQPAGLVMARIDRNTGRFATADNPDAIFEIFRAQNVPAPETASSSAPAAAESDDGAFAQQLF